MRGRIAYGCAMTRADDFFVVGQKTRQTGTEAVLEHVTDDIDGRDVTLNAPLHGRRAYAGCVDGFCAAVTQPRWTPREPVIT